MLQSYCVCNAIFPTLIFHTSWSTRINSRLREEVVCDSGPAETPTPGSLILFTLPVTCKRRVRNPSEDLDLKTGAWLRNSGLLFTFPRKQTTLATCSIHGKPTQFLHSQKTHTSHVGGESAPTYLSTSFRPIADYRREYSVKKEGARNTNDCNEHKT